jgi:3-isopropylmalate dehydratase small subunit
MASPAAVALGSLHGKITDPGRSSNERFAFRTGVSQRHPIHEGSRRVEGVWDYAAVNNLDTDQMFAGNLTYKIQSSDPKEIVPHLFEGFDPCFVKEVAAGDVILGGENFGCGSSREHPAVGLAHLGIRAVVVKSVNRIFYRSAINQGLPVIVHPGAVSAYIQSSHQGGFHKGSSLSAEAFHVRTAARKTLEILSQGLVNWILRK